MMTNLSHRLFNAVSDEDIGDLENLNTNVNTIGWIRILLFYFYCSLNLYGQK